MTRRLGLIGFPVQHSLSPALQQPGLDALGIEATYELWPTPLDALADRVASLREPDAMGANVTVPHKQAVIPFLDDLSETATRAQAVNTIVNRDGVLLGDNTDVHGLARSLTEAGVDREGFPALVLGAGGAARGILLALESLGVGHVTVANRTIMRAHELARSFPGIQVTAAGLDEEALLRHLSEAEVVINATSLGWKAHDTPVPIHLLKHVRPTSLVVDLTYRDTLLLQSAANLGLPTLDGLPMLVYQGARSLELWTQRSAPVELMMRHALEARSARS
jgi:shikimate dehydrogenase